jgi:bisphosphoglycerate-independent phosphoglycerate mutase (AlkP superfamily)
VPAKSLLAVGEDQFSGFDAGPRPHWAAMLGMVDYSKTHDAFMAAAYPKRPVINTLGAWVAAKGLTPVPAGRDGKISACHLLPERRARGP